MASKIAAVLTEATDTMMKIHTHAPSQHGGDDTINSEAWKQYNGVKTTTDGEIHCLPKTTLSSRGVWGALGSAWSILPFESLSVHQQEVCASTLLSAHKHVDRFGDNFALEALTSAIDAAEARAPLTLAWVELDAEERVEQSTPPQSTPPRPVRKKLKTQEQSKTKTLSPEDKDNIELAVVISGQSSSSFFFSSSSRPVAADASSSYSYYHGGVNTSPTGGAKSSVVKRVRFREPVHGVEDVQLPV
jgi:hypothetical protein